MKLVVQSLGDLGDDVVLAPERWIAAQETGDGVPLGELVRERRERADAEDAVVLDTTHARDGLLDLPAALRAASSAKSAKKLAREGDLVVSRLRPYLRQIALVHPRALSIGGGRELALSTEFYVLAPPSPRDDLAFLLPFLLGDRAQAMLAAAQEGGHHPRVPRSSLLALRVPKAVVESRARVAAEVRRALDDVYAAVERYHGVLAPGSVDRGQRPS